MLMASALGFIKLLALAYAMPAQAYGQYVGYIGIATFSSMLLSFGLIERTIKDYPRRWVSGQRTEVLIDAVQICRMLALRFIALGVLVFSLSFLNFIPVEPIAVLFTTGLALCTVFLTLVGSLYRAAGVQRALQNFTLLRSTLVMGLCLPVGSMLGWQGAIAGDIAGNLLSIGFAVWRLHRMYRKENFVGASHPDLAVSDKGHYKIYTANLAVAPQSMLDRVWVNVAIGPALAGSYGVVMLIPQAVQLLGNVIVQYVGPLVIKLVHAKKSNSNRQSTVAFNAALLALFSLALTLSALIAKRIPFLNHIFEKYAISDISLVMVGLISCGQIYALIEFHLIAHDRESKVLFASIVSSIIFIVTFAGAAAAHASVEWFLAGVGAARWVQVWLLRRAYLRCA